MTAAAVLAGGNGSRMNSSMPKQFIKLNGVPVIVYSINAFLQNSEIDAVIVCVPQNYISLMNKIISEYIDNTDKIRVIFGGKTRGDSLKCVLNFLERNNMLNNCVLLTHDAVRPFVTQRIINENIAAAKKYGACNTCVSATDTILLSSDGEYIESVPLRDNVFHAQTPQSFDAKLIYDLIKATPDSVFYSLTDGASVFLYNKKPVYIVKGEQYNIKITYPQDLFYAENIIKEYFSN